MKSRKISYIFDGDDTLWRNNVYFLRAGRSIFKHFGLSKIIDYKEYKKLLDDYELKYIESHRNAYGRNEFKKVIISFLTDLAIKNLSTSSVAKIVDPCFKSPPQLYPRARFVLKELSINNDLYLFTKGHYREQMDKIELLSIDKFFKRVIVVKSKDKDVLDGLIDKNHLDKKYTHIIGDSISNDIMPAIQVGIKAVYFNNPEAWVMEKELVPKNISIINKLDDLVSIFGNK